MSALSHTIQSVLICITDIPYKNKAKTQMKRNRTKKNDFVRCLLLSWT